MLLGNSLTSINVAHGILVYLEGALVSITRFPLNGVLENLVHMAHVCGDD